MVEWCSTRGGVEQQYIKLFNIKQGPGFCSILRLCGLFLVLLNTACSTLQSVPDKQASMRGSSAFVMAAKDPKTWIPAAAALLIAATGSDQSISRWASTENPVYGSIESANEASNNLRSLLATSAVVTSILSPGREDVLLPDRYGNMAVLASSGMTNSYITGSLKESTARMRPNQGEERSFPSSHTSSASSYATIASLRTNELMLSEKKRNWLSNTYYTLAAATAWARVEAKAHYPTDVLVGFALGNFTTRLLNGLLQGSNTSTQVEVECDQSIGGCQVIIRVPF
ncbi:MAG: phosphatase PAP2 family protein [Gammaproteobacteria bacterium]|nr:phosphatase PAP2 family protein [Gammaproteobacteria bacterium]